jgi:hypothetical protein
MRYGSNPNQMGGLAPVGGSVGFAGAGQQPPAFPSGTPAGVEPGSVNPQAANIIQRLLTTPRPGGLAGLQAGADQTGTGPAGAQGASFQEGVAGVASKSEQFGVKVYKGQESYNLWEFVFDYRDEQTAAGMTNAPSVPGINSGQPGLTPSGFMTSPAGGFPGGAPGARGEGRGRDGRGDDGQGGNRAGPGGPGGFGGRGGAPGFGPGGPGFSGPPTTTAPVEPPPAGPSQPGPGTPQQPQRRFGNRR